MSTALIAATDMPRRAICGMAWPAAAAVAARVAIVLHLPDRADVARIAADQLRPDFVVQHMHERAVGPGATGGVLTFAPADDAVIGLDAQDRSIERPHLTEVAPVLARGFDGYTNPPGFDLLDAHSHSPPIRRRRMGVMSQPAHDPEKLQTFRTRSCADFKALKRPLRVATTRGALEWQCAYFGIFLPISGNIVSAVIRIWSE